MRFITILAATLLLTFISCNTTKNTQQDNATVQTERPERNGQRGGAKGKKSPEEILKQFDKNSDGKLSKSEIKGPLANNFSQIDTNSDGFLTLDEIKNAPRPERR